MALVDLLELKEYIGSTGTSYDSVYEWALQDAEQEVLRFCRRSSEWTGFETSTGTRYYEEEDLIHLPYGSQYDSDEGGTHQVLWFGAADLLSVDSLTNGDGTAINSTSYRLYPRNKPPYRYLRLLSDESWSFDTDGEIELAGSWGYSTGPDATIKGAVMETAKYLIDLRQTGSAEVTVMPDLGQLQIPKGMPKHVQVALRKGGYIRSLGAD